MFDKKVTHETGMTLPGAINKELDRLWNMFEFILSNSKGGEHIEGNIQSIYTRIKKMHNILETLAEKYPDQIVAQSIKDLQENAVEQMLLNGKEEE